MNAIYPKTLRQGTLLMGIGLIGLTGIANASQTQDEPTEITTTVEGETAKANANPYASEGVPYKAKRTSDSRLTADIAQTPKVITVITKEAMEDSGLTDLKQVLATQPGITLGSGEGGNAFGDRYIIRGFEARNDNYINGLRDPGVVSRETFAIEQIEVYKGPSATIGGRGTTGGAINASPKQATDVSFTKVDLGVGSDAYVRATLDTNIVLNERVSVRINALGSDMDVPNRDGATRERHGLAVAAKWTLSPKMTLKADYYGLRANDVPDGGTYAVNPNATGATNPVKYYPIYAKYIGQVDRDFIEATSDVASVSFDYQIAENLRFESKLRYGETNNNYLITGLTYRATATPPTFGFDTKNGHQLYRTAAAQNNVIWDTQTFGRTHKIVFGYERSTESVLAGTYAVTANNTTWNQNLTSLDMITTHTWPGGTVVRNPSSTFASFKTDAVYVVSDIDLHPRLKLQTGLRLDRVNYRIRTSTLNTGYEDTVVNGNAGLVWQAFDQGNFYVSYATSTNLSGEQLDSASNCGYGGYCGDNTKPERNVIAEVGSKWNLMDDRLLLTASVFDITKDNAFEPAGAGYGVVAFQVAKVRVQGVELSVAGNISDRLSVVGGVSLLDSEILESNTPTEVGREKPNTPKESANLLVRYQANDQWAFGGNLTYVGEVNAGQPTGSAGVLTLPSYTRIDLFANYKIDDNKTLRFNAQNVTDEVYYTTAYRGNKFIYPGDAASVKVTLSLEF